jgi:succinate dehydrogenase/fumarate reductase iron-sulfur protein
MLINGKPQLACDTLLEDGMRLEPLSRYAVLRDLVVDNEVMRTKLKELNHWPVTEHRDRDFTVSKKVRADFEAIYSRCIECGCCLEACPASFDESSRFDGPMYSLLMARAAAHPMDSMDRVKQVSDRGIWACVSCYECADVCPMNLNPAKEITKFRRKAISQSLLRLFALRKGKPHD